MEIVWNKHIVEPRKDDLPRRFGLAKITNFSNRFCCFFVHSEERTHETSLQLQLELGLLHVITGLLHVIESKSFKTIAIDTPGGNLSLVRNVKAQTTALNRAITQLNRDLKKKIVNEALLYKVYQKTVNKDLK